MNVFCCAYASGRVKLSGPVDYRWIELDKLKAYPLPKANHKFLSRLFEWYKTEAGTLGGGEGKKVRG